MTRDSLSTGAELTATITVGVDGRVYFHDLTAGLLRIATALSPDSPAVWRRQGARLDLQSYECQPAEREDHDRATENT